MRLKLWQILLAVWLIATGLLVLTNLTIALAPVILSVLAIAAGVCILFDR